MRDRTQRLFRDVQDEICAALERLDGGRFREDEWTRPDGGGGRTRVLQEGGFFSKAGVNVSAVHGELPAAVVESARGRGIDLGEESRRFFATGVSLVLHPVNPFAPTVHANYRYFELEEAREAPMTSWFGGGADLTPCYLFAEDARHFHQVHRDACDRHDPAFHERFKRWCDEYFHLPHRGETRGVGGIFFDNLADRDPALLFAFVADCARSFLPAILPIYDRRKDAPYDERHVRWQRLRRGRYVEFNLVYDRGTSFGLRTGGRTESILMSLPLEARWEYDHQPDPGSPEAELIEALRAPRDWLAD